MTKLEAPDMRSSNVNPGIDTWVVLCKYAQWCGFMNIPATYRPFLQIEWIFTLHLFVFKVAVFFCRLFMSQVNVHDLWPYAGLPCCVGILSICPHSFLSHSMQELFQTLSTIWKPQFYHPCTFRRQTCFLVQRVGDGLGGVDTEHKTKPLQLPDITFTHLFVSGPNLSAIAGLMPHLFPGPHPLHFPKSPYCWTCRSLFPYKNNAVLVGLHWCTLGCLFSFSIG